MIARLQRAYGGEFEQWYERTPLVVMRRLFKIITRLHAEDALRQAEAVALGSGTMKKQAAQDLERRLRREASFSTRPRRPTALDLERFRTDLGISIEKVPNA